MLRDKVIESLLLEDIDEIKKLLKEAIYVECSRCGVKKIELSRYDEKICRDCETSLM